MQKQRDEGQKVRRKKAKREAREKKKGSEEKQRHQQKKKDKPKKEESGGICRVGLWCLIYKATINPKLLRTDLQGARFDIGEAWKIFDVK